MLMCMWYSLSDSFSLRIKYSQYLSVSKSSGLILLRVPMLFGIIKLKASMGEPKGLGGENHWFRTHNVSGARHWMHR